MWTHHTTLQQIAISLKMGFNVFEAFLWIWDASHALNMGFLGTLQDPRGAKVFNPFLQPTAVPLSQIQMDV